MKNIVISYCLHPENVQRLKKNGGPTTLIFFKLKNESEEQYAKT